MYSFVVLLCVVITWYKMKEYVLKLFEYVLYCLCIAYIVKGILIFEGIVLVSFLLCFLSFFYLVFVREKGLLLCGCFLKATCEKVKGSFMSVKALLYSRLVLLKCYYLEGLLENVKGLACGWKGYFVLKDLFTMEGLLPIVLVVLKGSLTMKGFLCIVVFGIKGIIAFEGLVSMKGSLYILLVCCLSHEGYYSYEVLYSRCFLL